VSIAGVLGSMILRFAVLRVATTSLRRVEAIISVFA
jgi:hypothetical protein